jgi:hypothetical protein
MVIVLQIQEAAGSLYFRGVQRKLAPLSHIMCTVQSYCTPPQHPPLKLPAVDIQKEPCTDKSGGLSRMTSLPVVLYLP